MFDVTLTLAIRFQEASADEHLALMANTFFIIPARLARQFDASPFARKPLLPGPNAKGNCGNESELGAEARRKKSFLRSGRAGLANDGQ